MGVVSNSPALRIVHVFRAPLGGLFRHVIDLSVEQAARGHKIGLFFDSGGECERVREAIARIPEASRLGVVTAPIRRNPHPSDLTSFRALSRFLADVKPDIVHGHGSKGGLYARLSHGAVRAYTPHGGSFNYSPGSLLHRVYMLVERAVASRTELFLFESAHIGGVCERNVGLTHSLARVVVNGLSRREFSAVRAAPDATDVLYVGELRSAKGVDTLIDALGVLAREQGEAPSATFVGSGPDRDALVAQAERQGLSHLVRFPGPMPVAEAFTLGRLMVTPSRAESLPYIVLETVAAQLPLLTTDVGGIPEIFGPYADRLFPPGDPQDLARRIAVELARPAPESAARAAEVAAYVRDRFSLSNMAETVISAYRDALARRDRATRESGKAARAAELVNEA